MKLCVLLCVCVCVRERLVDLSVEIREELLTALKLLCLSLLRVSADQ